MNWNVILNSGYEVIIAAIIANVSAQILKTIVNAIEKRTFDSSMLYSTGGMPSSHSSFVVSVATSIGIIDGFNSTTFALALCVATVVMYDATGVRLAASKQAIILNQILKELFSLHPTLKGKHLKELLGHTPVQVLAGAALGIVVSFGLHAWILKYAV